MTRRQKFFSALGTFFKNVFTKNIPLKIIALLFAILLWGYVLAIENPEYVKRVRDVDITIVGEDTLNNRGLMLVTRDTGKTDVDVLCKISKHSELDASRVTCTVDLSSIAYSLDRDEDSKTIPVEVQAKVASEYGTVQGLSVGTVDLTVARLSSRSNLLVTINTQGTLVDGFDYSLPDELTISSLRGQKSEIDRIAYAEVTVDLDSFAVNDPEMLAGTYDLVLPVQFFDSANVRLNDIVTSSGETITTNLRVVIRAYRDVPIEPRIIVSDLFDSRYDYEATLSQDTVRLYGDRAALDAIESVKTEQILPKMYAGEERQTVSLLIPAGVQTDRSQSKSVTVYLQVNERVLEDVEFGIPITYSETKKGVELTGDEPKTVTVFVSGTVAAIDAFDPGWLSADVDLSNYGEGRYEDLPIRITFTGNRDLYRYRAEMEIVSVELRPVGKTETASNPAENGNG